MITLLILLYIQGIVYALSFTALILAVISGLAGIVIYIDKGVWNEVCKKCLKWGLILLSVAVFTPSKDTLSVSIGLYATSDVIEAASHSEIAQKAIKAINVQLDSLGKTDAEK